MNNPSAVDWADYIHQMEALLALELDETQRQELRLQLTRIAALAEPLMALALDQRLEIAGVYRA